MCKNTSCHFNYYVVALVIFNSNKHFSLFKNLMAMEKITPTVSRYTHSGVTNEISCTIKQCTPDDSFKVILNIGYERTVFFK